MINNLNELVLAIYMGIAFFFIGYYLLGNSREQFMTGTFLNYVFIAFFIILFFLVGYLFKNIILSFYDAKKQKDANK